MEIKFNGVAAIATLAGMLYLPGAHALSIDSDTTFNAGEQTFNENIDINNGATLTIDAGAILRFGAGYRINVQSGGRLVVLGSNGDPVRFTSDGAAPGSWQGITVYGERSNTADVQIDNAVIEYANVGVRFEQGAKGDVSNSTLQYNNHGIDFFGKRSGGAVTGNVIKNNGYGVYIYANFGYQVDHPQVSVTGNSLYDNTSYSLYGTFFYDSDKVTYDATGNWWGTTDLSAIAAKIYDRADEGTWAPSVDFSGILTSEGGSPTTETLYTASIGQDTTWTSTNGKMAQPITVSNGATLTIAAGAKVEAIDSGELIINNGGQLLVQGTTGNPVVFTHADMIKGKWKGITVKGERADSSAVQINHAVLEYADYAVRFEEGSKGDVRNSTLRYNNRAVFYNGKRTGGTVQYSALHDNQYGVYINGAFSYKADHPEPVVIDSSLYDNTSYNYYGMYYYDRDKTTLNATGNWWGSADLATVAGAIYDNSDDASWAPAVDYSGLLTSLGGSSIGNTLYTASISSDTTWSATDGLMTQPIKVNTGVTLTLAAGAQIEAAAGSELVVEDGGKLVVQGTQANPVTFSGQTQSVGSWKGITVKGERSDTSGLQLDHAVVEFANYGVKFEQGAKGDITNSILRNNTYAVHYNGKRTGGTVTGSQLYMNQYGVYINGAFSYLADHPTPVVTGNSFHDNSSYNYYGLYYYDRDKTILNATGNWWGTTDLTQVTAKIYDNVDNPSWSPSIDFSGLLTSEFGMPTSDTLYTTNISGNVNWSATNGVMAQKVTINPGAILTVSPGAIVSVPQGGALTVASGGQLNVAGTQANPVAFTGVTPTRGSWNGIIVKGERSNGSEVVLNNAVVEYANYGVMFETGAKADVLSSILRNNNYALYYSGHRSGGTVNDSKLHDNNYGVYINGSFAYEADHPKPVLANSSLYNNANYNYYVIFYQENSKTVLNATNNWWGTSDLSAIAASIYDKQNDASWSPTVDYSQMLQSDGGDPVPGTHLIGSINGQTLWQFDQGLVLADMTVEEGAELIIEADTQLQFANGAGLTVKKGGNLTVVGESDKPVTFTSNAATPAAGNWDGISVKAESGDVTITNAVIEYANMGIEFSGKQANGLVTQSTIENNNYGVYVYGAGLGLAYHPNPVVSTSKVQNNNLYNYYSSSFGNADQRSLNATGNHWGTMDSATINQKVYDYSDTTSSPTVNLGTVAGEGVQLLNVNGGVDFIAFGTVNATLDASGSSTTDGSITSYNWRQYSGMPVTLNNASTAIADFTAADPASESKLSFLVTATTDTGLTATDKVQVTLKPYSEFNQPPVVPEVAVLLVEGGSTVNVDLTASDGDNDPLTYQWQQIQGPSITPQSVNTGLLMLDAPVVYENTLLVYRLTVSDGQYNITRDVQVGVKQKRSAIGTFYYHNDHLGTPQLMTDKNANIVWKASYTPFGNANISIETVVNNIRFPGQYYDQESGLHYNYFRDYDPETGRYVQSDPIGLAGGINTYGYGFQNPILNIDPLGLQVEGVYNKTTGILTIKNLDNGKILTATAFSGTPGQYSPAPNGTYTLSDFPWGSSIKEHYFALLLNDGRLDDYADGHPSNYDPSKTMSNIRLHAGYASHACVTVPGEADSAQWLPIQMMIQGTSKGKPIVIGDQSFPNYGTIKVIGSGYGSVP